MNKNDLKKKPNFISCIPGNEPTQCRPGQEHPPLKTREELDSALKREPLAKAHLQHKWVNRVNITKPRNIFGIVSPPLNRSPALGTA